MPHEGYRAHGAFYGRRLGDNRNYGLRGLFVLTGRMTVFKGAGRV